MALESEDTLVWYDAFGAKLHADAAVLALAADMAEASTAEDEKSARAPIQKCCSAEGSFRVSRFQPYPRLQLKMQYAFHPAKC